MTDLALAPSTLLAAALVVAFVEAGEPITVVRVEGNRIVVRRLPLAG